MPSTSLQLEAQPVFLPDVSERDFPAVLPAHQERHTYRADQPDLTRLSFRAFREPKRSSRKRIGVQQPLPTSRVVDDFEFDWFRHGLTLSVHLNNSSAALSSLLCTVLLSRRFTLDPLSYNGSDDVVGQGNGTEAG